MKDYATSKKDMKKGVEIVPEENYRLRAEDIYEVTVSSGGSGSLDHGLHFGSKGGATTTTGSSFGLESQMPDDIKQKSGFREASQTLYARHGDNKVDLKDFAIKKVIGRGSFGKVFLVEKKGSKEVYAMKSLRKDVIIDYD